MSQVSNFATEFLKRKDGGGHTSVSSTVNASNGNNNNNGTGNFTVIKPVKKGKKKEV